MHRIAIAFALVATSAIAGTSITVSKQYGFNDPNSARFMLGQLHDKAFESCPSGWEKLREYTTRDGDKYFLHFEIRCLVGAPTAAK